jgi:imidazolonepropionase-like amidohydrolase
MKSPCVNPRSSALICGSHLRSSAAAGVLLAVALCPGGKASAQQPDSIIEQGSFIIHKFLQPIGRESYTITRTGEGLALADSFSFTDRGSPVVLNATLVSAADLAPIRFAIKGKTSRSSTIDDGVDIEGDSARIRIDSTLTAIARPDAGFTIAGYAPIALQQAMVRYWHRHGSPSALTTLPSGRVTVSRRGTDTVTAAGRPVILTRYSVAGLIWGRETLWFNGDEQLVAAVTIDAEFDHLEAIRDEYEPELSLFVSRAAADASKALAELAGTPDAGAPGNFALVGGTLIDGNGGPPVANAVVIVKQGRISAAGAGIKVPRGMTVIETRGKSILPGLWDMHAHYEQVEWGPIYLAAGVTTARDVGNEFEFITGVRDAIAAGRGVGPRLLLAGIVDGNSPYALGVDRADTPEQAVAMVQRYHAAGFQQMKIYSSVKAEIVAAIAAEAHRLGMTVTGHIPRGMDAYQGVEAGMDQINHITYVYQVMRTPPPVGSPDSVKPTFDLQSAESERAVAFLAAHHTVVDPTIALYEIFLHPENVPVSTFEPGVARVAPELAGPLNHTGVPAADSAAAQARFADLLSIIGALHRAGVPIVAGTDQAVPGYSLHREMELYVKAGFTPMEAIQAATLVPARAMGVQHDVGTLTAGKRADILVVEGNPLEDITALRNVRLVVAGGRRYEPAPMWESVGFLP